MPEYLAPGVYIEEISTGPKPIEGVGTSTAGFVGETERGPLPPRLITSWLAFQRWYGGFLPDSSYLPYAIKGFFDNGGKRCFVTRVVPDGAAPAVVPPIGALKLIASGPGLWGNNLRVRISKAEAAADDTGEFNLEVVYFGDAVPADIDANLASADLYERFDDLTHIEGRSNNVITVVNAASKLVKCVWEGGPSQAVRPANGEFDANSAAGGTAGGGPIQASDFTGKEGPVVIEPNQEPPLSEPLGRDWGLTALAKVDEVAILLAPDEVRAGNSSVTGEVIKQCQNLKDRFAIVSATQGQSSVGNLRPPEDTLYAAFYYPWIEIFDAANNKPQVIPPSGHIAGIYARTDIERGVHKAPANEVVRGARELEFPVTKGMQGILNPRGVNCIRDFRSDGRGIRLWGARTMSSDPEWKYVNVRRLFIFVEESVEEATQWVVFEPNHEPTWAKVVRSITNFLIRVWRNGALQGITQEEAFFVKCDRTTMTQDDIDNGRLICLVGIAPVKPAEFVIFRFSQKTIEFQA